MSKTSGTSKTHSQSLEIFRAEQEFLAPGTQNVALLSRLVLDRGQGCYLIDADGRRYLDFMAGIGVCSLGHSHPRYIAALTAQLNRVTVGNFTTENRLKFLTCLASLAPGEMSLTQLYSGGSEAVEAAIRLAKSYTKKFEILAFWGGFHGKTGGVLGLMGNPFKQHWGPLHPGLYLTPYANCYRCAFKLQYPSCGLHCLDFARQVVKLHTTGELAAIIVEPIQGTAGNVVPPPEFLPGLAQIAKEHGALLIADEMLTGFGRTGRLFGMEHFGVTPDVMTIGKGMGNGFPVSGLISTPTIMAATPYSRPSAASSSYGGNPLAATAAWISLEIILEENLVENSRRVGAFLLTKLIDLQEKYPFIGQVQGRGLMIGMELVKDQRSKEPLESHVTEIIFRECLKRGLLAMNYAPHFRLNPPLTLTQDQAQAGAAILDEVFAYIQREVPYH